MKVPIGPKRKFRMEKQIASKGPRRSNLLVSQWLHANWGLVVGQADSSVSSFCWCGWDGNQVANAQAAQVGADRQKDYSAYSLPACTSPVLPRCPIHVPLQVRYQMNTSCPARVLPSACCAIPERITIGCEPNRS
jgi:hypothetical protein